MSKHSKLLLALKTLQAALLLWVLFTLAPRLLPQQHQFIAHLISYLNIVISCMVLFFLGFRSIGGIRTCAYLHITYTLFYVSYMIWLMIQILPGNCITCLSPEFVVFFSVQTGVTMLVMVTLTILWIFVLVKKIDFQRHIVEDIVSEVESIQEPLPFYTKEELPSYDEVIPETRDLENPPVEREP